MNEGGEPVANDVDGSPEGENDEYERFESLARTVVNTPKPASADESVGKSADGGSEREREG